MVDLAHVDYDSDGPAPPLLIAHGLFGSARNWNVIARRLSDRGPVRAVDMRNHGDSPREKTHDYDALADDLAGAMEPGWDVLGHSMGGKAAMVLALRQPERVRRLVVADIAPVAYGHSHAHLVRAMQALDLAAIDTRRDADAALAAQVDTPAVRSFLLQSLDMKDKRWLLNLDVLGREMGAISGWPDTRGSYGAPALFLSGGDSDYVTRDMHDAIRTLFPKARFAAIPGADHWLHAARPREFVAAVRAFLDA
ncbi:alpha/beta fold hydrolase [Palleronia rufa]|uniref:alpha/beta fold hydrolase n=1 Tax=Palleronia rufa TaxID=1530186 RepID=UPI00056CE5B3|nr:alpha/beta fold hydrolase [Palleronia rufa]